MSPEKSSTDNGTRFSVEECVEILAECSLIEESIKALREKAEKDMEWHFRPALRLVE